MVTAVVLAVLVMLLAAEPISAFVEEHPTIKVLALSFLLLIGMSLIADGLDQHIPKGYIYFAMALLGVRRDDQHPGAQEGRSLSSSTSRTWNRRSMRIRRSRPSCFACALFGGDARRRRATCRIACSTRPRGAFSDFEAMAADLATADVVFVGEQHDDPNTHRLELAVLEALARRQRPVVLSLEMFERDVQEPLDHFLMGHMEEDEFLKASRPWPRYATDYKPLVDFAVAKNWPVVAANVPRPIASEVAKGGLEVLQAKTDDGSQAVRARSGVSDERRVLQALRRGDGRPSRPPAPRPTRRRGRPSATTSRSA